VSITAAVTNHIKFSGDQSSEVIYGTGPLADSPCLQELVTLAIGNNTITVPAVDDFTVHGVAIVPPAANTTQPTIKGVNGDTGFALGASQVSVLQFGDTVPASFVLNVAAEIVGLRLVWF
jgi:hypothetical protein